MKQHIHNSIRANQFTLELMEVRAETLERKIYSFFRKNAGLSFTPVEVQNKMKITNNPLTSVRRAITNLTNDNKLIKTQEMREGLYGVANFCWTLNINY